MKKTCYLILLAIPIVFSCKKNIDGLTPDSDYVENAKKYFEAEVCPKYSSGSLSNIARFGQNQRKRSERYPAWNEAKVIELRNEKAVLVPIYYKNPFLVRSGYSGNRVYNINDIQKLLIYTDSNNLKHAELLSYIPDSLYKGMAGETFKGIITVEDWGFNLLKRLKYGSNNGKSSSNLGDVTEQSQKVIQVCYYIEGYNYSPNDPEGYYWSELIGCDYYSFESGYNYGSGIIGGADPGGGYGGGGVKPISPAKTFTIPTPDNAISNIRDYNRCFTNVAGSNYSYSATICVSQPRPGSREPWVVGSTGGTSATGNPVFVGHTFLIIKEVTPTRTVVRSIGFYPSSGVNPLSPSAPGVFNNDQYQDYDISLTVKMNNSQFFSLLNYIAQGDKWIYDLNSFNCTSFVLNGMAAAGFSLPRTNGTWVNGGGNNPGDLGEDIRGMQLSSNMTKTTTYGTHPNQGQCD